MRDSSEPISIIDAMSVVAVSGEVDASTAPTLAVALAAAEADDPLVVDLSGVTFMDSSGLRVLLEAHRRQREAGHELVLRRASATVERLFELAGVHQLFDAASDSDVDAGADT